MSHDSNSRARVRSPRINHLQLSHAINDAGAWGKTPTLALTRGDDKVKDVLDTPRCPARREGMPGALARPSDRPEVTGEGRSLNGVKGEFRRPPSLHK